MATWPIKMYYFGIDGILRCIFLLSIFFHLNDSEEDSDGSVESDSIATSPDAGLKRKERVPQKPSRKAKKGRVTAATAMVDLTGKLVEIQSLQMEMMERAQSGTEELLIKMEKEQRKLDEVSRRRNQGFFLRMAELLKK